MPPFCLPRAFGSLAQRFLDIIHNWEAMQHGCSILVRAAKCLELPVIVTEQYTKVFGKTVPELAEHLEVSGAYNTDCWCPTRGRMHACGPWRACAARILG